MPNNKSLTEEEKAQLLKILRVRFINSEGRFVGVRWEEIQSRMEQNPDKLWSLYEMERSGGEPNLLEFDLTTNDYVFCDFSKESPTGRRSLCYDAEALASRKKFKPEDSAKAVASHMGIELLNEEHYRKLQAISACDTKTSSWLDTPAAVRTFGGALFGDFRFGRVFIYHNGAESYYAARGFRGLLRV